MWPNFELTKCRLPPEWAIWRCLLSPEAWEVPSSATSPSRARTQRSSAPNRARSSVLGNNDYDYEQQAEWATSFPVG